MAKKLDKIVVVDLEATCWDGLPPEGMTSDIIEIGVCLLDIQTGEITDNRGILIKPERSEISEFCTSLTTITPTLIESEGISFKDACSILKKQYQSQDRVWASYGAYDFKQVTKQCKDLGIGYPFSPSHINVKVLFGLKHKLSVLQGMSEALQTLQIPLEGTHHRGVDDAKNIAKILRTLL